MADSLDTALRAVERGQPIVYPTDTLWGLGVRPNDRRAVARLYALKGRPEGMPVSVAVSSYEELEPWVVLSPERRGIVRATLPGPYTFLLPATPRARRVFVASILGGGGTLGIRIPDHPIARRLLARTGPLTATSANPHGRPPGRSLSEARRAFGSGVGAYVDGLPLPSGRPSHIVALTGTRPRPVRRG